MWLYDILTYPFDFNNVLFLFINVHVFASLNPVKLYTYTLYDVSLYVHCIVASLFYCFLFLVILHDLVAWYVLQVGSSGAHSALMSPPPFNISEQNKAFFFCFTLWRPKVEIITTWLFLIWLAVLSPSLSFHAVRLTNITLQDNSVRCFFNKTARLKNQKLKPCESLLHLNLWCFLRHNLTLCTGRMWRYFVMST